MYCIVYTYDVSVVSRCTLYLNKILFTLTYSSLGLKLNVFYWYQIFTLDTAVVEAQNVKLTWRLPNYCNVLGSGWGEGDLVFTIH